MIHQSYPERNVFNSTARYRPVLYQRSIDEMMRKESERARKIEQLPDPASAALSKEKLFNSAASYKMLLSRVSMHLPVGWRERLSDQIDSLLDPEEWDEHEAPPSLESIKTFVRMLLVLKPGRRPGLAAGGGHIFATWTVGKNRLTVECLESDRIRFALTRDMENSEKAAGANDISRLGAILAPYQPEVWFET